jgi:hypothetical protein
MKKRGSLELSVNAIVIFIIAFAMLGVGLFFINKVRNTVDIDPGSFIPANQMKNPPSSEDPLTIDSEVKMKNGDKKKITLGFYPKTNPPTTGIGFYISECVNSANNQRIFRDLATDINTITCEPAEVCVLPESVTAWSLPIFTPTSSINLKQGEGVGLPKILNGMNALVPNTDYVCTMIAYDSTATEKVIASKTFYLSILS